MGIRKKIYIVFSDHYCSDLRLFYFILFFFFNTQLLVLVKRTATYMYNFHLEFSRHIKEKSYDFLNLNLFINLFIVIDGFFILIQKFYLHKLLSYF